MCHYRALFRIYKMSMSVLLQGTTLIYNIGSSITHCTGKNRASFILLLNESDSDLWPLRQWFVMSMADSIRFDRRVQSIACTQTCWSLYT